MVEKIVDSTPKPRSCLILHPWPVTRLHPSDHNTLDAAFNCLTTLFGKGFLRSSSAWIETPDSPLALEIPAIGIHGEEPPRCETACRRAPLTSFKPTERRKRRMTATGSGMRRAPAMRYGRGHAWMDGGDVSRGAHRPALCSGHPVDHQPISAQRNDP